MAAILLRHDSADGEIKFNLGPESYVKIDISDLEFLDSKARKALVDEVLHDKHHSTDYSMRFLFSDEYDNSKEKNHGPHFWKQIKESPNGLLLLRYMKSLSTTVSRSSFIRVLMLLMTLQLFLPRHSWGGKEDSKNGLVTILSLVEEIVLSANNQDPHIDYNFWKIFDRSFMVPGVTLPLVFILALQPGCKIIVYDKNGSPKEIDIPEGHLFVMSGDCVHAGYTFTTINCRIHFYFEAIDLMTSDQNETGWFHEYKGNLQPNKRRFGENIQKY